MRPAASTTSGVAVALALVVLFGLAGRGVAGTPAAGSADVAPAGSSVDRETGLLGAVVSPASAKRHDSFARAVAPVPLPPPMVVLGAVWLVVRLTGRPTGDPWSMRAACRAPPLRLAA